MPVDPVASRHSSPAVVDPVAVQPVLTYSGSHYHPPGTETGPRSPVSAAVTSICPHSEADIAESSGQLDEKLGLKSPLKDRADSTSVEEARALNWIVPVRKGLDPETPSTIWERLEPTRKAAQVEQEKYATRAQRASLAVNAAMFAQIIANAIITGLSAASGDRHAQLGVSALGAVGTIIASFLVRVRGTREPERSVTHAQNLEKFLRELDAFMQDERYSRDRRWDDQVNAFRAEFEKLQTAVHQSENGQPMSKS